MQTSSARVYLENKVMTATPEQLQLMLYEGAIRFAQQSRTAMSQKDFEQSYIAYERFNDIMCELHSGLRSDRDPSLFEKMGALYTFCQRRMNEGQFHRNTRYFDDALSILQHLRETWLIVMEKIRQERGNHPMAAKMEKYAPLCVDA